MTVEKSTDVTKRAGSPADRFERQERVSAARWRLFVERLGTYLLSLVLALVIWLVAVNEENPIITQPFPTAIPIQVRGPDEGLQTVQNLSKQTVQINVRAPQKTWNSLTLDDFQAYVDLTGLSPGEHDVKINVDVLDPKVDVLERQPSELRVEIDPVLVKEMAVEVDIVDSPAPGYEAQAPVIEPISVTVSGPATQVKQVASVRAEVYLDNAKSQVERNEPVKPYNSQDQFVEQVKLEPDSVRIIVPVSERPGRKEVAVRPDLVGQPAAGYRLASVRVNPSSVVLLGSVDALSRVPGFVSTTEVSLEGATEDLTQRVELILPEGVNALEGYIVELSATITPIEGGRTIKQKPVIQGLGPGLEATVALDEVEVILSGPAPLLESMAPDDMFVILDLTGLLPGTHNIRPDVILPDGIRMESVLPETVEVVITEKATTPTPEAGGTLPPLTRTPTITTTPAVTTTRTP